MHCIYNVTGIPTRELIEVVACMYLLAPGELILLLCVNMQLEFPLVIVATCSLHNSTILHAPFAGITFAVFTNCLVGICGDIAFIVDAVTR